MSPWVPDQDFYETMGQRQVSCPGCGLLHDEIAMTHRVGCPLCFDTFRPLAQQAIAQSQGGSWLHTGRQPQALVDRLRGRAQAYTEAIRVAEAEGRLDDASVLRDLLNILVRDLE